MNPWVAVIVVMLTTGIKETVELDGYASLADCERALSAVVAGVSATGKVQEWLVTGCKLREGTG